MAYYQPNSPCGYPCPGSHYDIEYGRALVMDRTTLTRNLKPLEREGLLSVSPGKDDQRVREVRLTSKGLKQLKQALSLWN